MRALSSFDRLESRASRWPPLRKTYRLLRGRARMLRVGPAGETIGQADGVVDRSNAYPQSAKSSRFGPEPGEISQAEDAGESELTGFSLVVGTFGRTEELKLLLDSLAAQTYRNLELIVVDQNPDDRLEPILLPYRNVFPVLHLRSKPGLSRAKNLGLGRASRGIIGFPDDDCSYPASLLQEVGQFFADHPERDGLTIRSIDEFGVESGGKSARRSGTVNKFNVWNRGGAYTMFVRAKSVRGIRYDEDMGPGAGTEWGAGDDKDYLLQILERGGSLFYDRRLAAIHPSRVLPYEKAAYRAYTYERGAGRAIRKRDFPLWFRVGWLIKPLVGIVLYLLGLKKVPAVKYRWNVFKGRFRGLVHED